MERNDEIKKIEENLKELNKKIAKRDTVKDKDVYIDEVVELLYGIIKKGYVPEITVKELEEEV